LTHSLQFPFPFTIPRKFAHKFVYIAGIRNFLAHDYMEDTTREIEKFLRYGLADIDYFLKLVEDYDG